MLLVTGRTSFPRTDIRDLRPAFAYRPSPTEIFVGAQAHSVKHAYYVCHRRQRATTLHRSFLRRSRTDSAANQTPRPVRRSALSDDAISVSELPGTFSQINQRSHRSNSEDPTEHNQVSELAVDRSLNLKSSCQRAFCQPQKYGYYPISHGVRRGTAGL